MEISLVIPVFNLREYIKQFFNDCLNQSLDNSLYEIIFVDDQSTDGTYELLLELKDNYSKEIKISVFRLEEKLGAGGARNLGIEYAKGKYIAFPDGDDILDKKYLEKLYNAIISEDADVVVSNYIQLNMKKNETKLIEVYKEGKILTEATPWNKLYKRSLFVDNDIKYQPIIKHQDLGTIPKVLYKAKKIIYIDDYLYTYRLFRKNSITNNAVSLNNDEDIYKISLDLIEYFSSYKEIGQEMQWLIIKNLFSRHKLYANLSLMESIKNHKRIIHFLDKYMKDWKENTFYKNNPKYMFIYKLNYMSAGYLSTFVSKLWNKVL